MRSAHYASAPNSKGNSSGDGDNQGGGTSHLLYMQLSPPPLKFASFSFSFIDGLISVSWGKTQTSSLIFFIVLVLHLAGYYRV